MCMYVFGRVYICIPVFMEYMCVYVYMNMYVYVCIGQYICICECVFRYMCTYTYVIREVEQFVPSHVSTNFAEGMWALCW